jgi:hypothetical protein
LERLVRILDHPLTRTPGGNDLDLNWMLDWADSRKGWLDRNKGPTVSMIEYWERIIERGEDL